jgi:ribosomal-protein-alanine N-acetyltransferase
MLIGKNVRLQPWTVEDAQLVADWLSDPEYLGEYYNVWPLSRAAMEHFIAEQAHGPEQHAYFIMSRDAKEYLGATGYWNPFASKFANKFFMGSELWWHVHPRFRRQGIASQAVCLLVNHIFDATPTERLQATIVVGNDASCRVAERAGMQRDGLYRNVGFLHGRYVNMHLYAIVRGDWENEGAYREGRPDF